MTAVLTTPELIAAIRQLTRITPEALARKLGVSATELRRWAEGQAKAPASARRQLQDFHGRALESTRAPKRESKSPKLDSAIVCADSIEWLRRVPDDSIDMILSDIPYGIGQDAWDVLHDNSNSAYLGQSQAQRQAGAIFEKRRKPINGWSAADREIPRKYQEWCASFASTWLRVLKPGGSALVFAGRRHAHRATAALEDAGFNCRDVLGWVRPRAVFRAQRLSAVLQKRGELGEAQAWAGWRLGNLRPVFEPILWLFKPYALTIADNVLEQGVGAFNLGAYEARTGTQDNLLQIGFRNGEGGEHEAQKPVELLRTLIELCTPAGAIVLDPFAGSGSTGVAAVEAGRRYLLIERDDAHAAKARKRVRAAKQALARSPA